ncbi:MAG: sulfotransferase domain-containing protein [Phycisphaerae bacterium]|jgi:hypothetical protein
MPRLPDFIIIGAMKCATSTLHDQLGLQPGIFVSEPKEPNFFSNDEEYARGLDHYAALFAAAEPGALCGESSTHYTKLPTYPRTVERMKRHLDQLRLIYVMRHPVDRLVSHYVHEWTERTIECPIDRAVREFPRLIDYGRYAMQLEPFLAAYGRQSILPVFFERLVAEPQRELERVCRFIGYAGRPVWHHEEAAQNVSQERLRVSPLRDAIVWNPLVTWVRRRFIPQSWRDRVKRLWQMRKRPRLSPESLRLLQETFDQDLARLGELLGVSINCANFKAVARSGEYAIQADHRRSEPSLPPARAEPSVFPDRNTAEVCAGEVRG